MTVEVRNVTVKFSRWGQEYTALKDVSLSLRTGQWVMLVGHNGAGKSTLLNVIGGRLAPDHGSLSINGNQLSKMRNSQIAQHVFHVHQSPLLGTAPDVTLFDNLMGADYQAQLEKTRRRDLYEKYRKLLRPLGLSDRMEQVAGNLSGGERQLIALMIARLRPSSLMLLDEPLAALDPAKAELCLGEITALNKAGKTILQVAHDERMAAQLGDRTIAIRGGRIIYDEVAGNRTLDDIAMHQHPVGAQIPHEPS